MEALLYNDGHDDNDDDDLMLCVTLKIFHTKVLMNHHRAKPGVIFRENLHCLLLSRRYAVKLY